MEEQGTEIVLQPGTDILQYCITEAVEEAKLNEEVLSPNSVKSVSGGENPPDTSPPSPSTEEEEERQESSTDREFFAEPKEQPPLQEVNRHDSLCDSSDEDEESVDEENYHPALKAAVYTEGQEAVWHEDEYSTVSSVYYVKPEKETAEVTRSQKTRMKMKVPFFKSRGKKAQKDKPTPEEVEPTRPVKIHIKKKQVAKAVVLLPPKETGTVTKEEHVDEEIIDCDKLMSENERYAAIAENSMQARRLLDTALSGDEIDEEESERITKEAFNHATTARRLADDIVEDDDEAEEAIELENIMSQLAEEGEYAALQHRQQYSVDEDDDRQEGARYTNAIDLTMLDADEAARTEKKKRGKTPVSGYASRAVHYLESILPQNFGKTKNVPDDASNSEDFWTDAGISTLGLKNDTQEYGLNSDEGNNEQNDAVNEESAALPRVTDMMSLSSLNEILDGNGTVTQKKTEVETNDVLNEEMKRRKKSLTDPSPRAAVREIGIPRKKKEGLPPTHPKQKRSGILGLMTPKIPKPSIFFNKTPRGNEEPEENDLDVGISVEKVEGDADSYVDMPEANRYDAAFDDDESKAKRPDRYRLITENDDIEMKLSIATDDDSQTEARYDGKLPDDIVTPQSSSPEEMGDSPQEKVEETSVAKEEERLDMSSDDDKSEDDENQDRYQTEPVGMTPRRDGLEVEENTDKKVEEENTTLAVEKEEEEEDEKPESNPEKTDGSENKKSVENSGDKDPACDSDKVSNPDAETSVEDETKPSTSGKGEEEAVKGNDETSAPQSKSKIFDRVVDVADQKKRKPLVPNAVVEEKYLVDKDMKKISTEEEKVHKPRNPAKAKKDLRKPVSASKAAAARRAALSQMKNIPKSPAFTVIDDSTTVVQEAISKGALMAVESNEKGDDIVPTNYLSSMLKKKLDSGELNQERTLDDKHQDADSYVAAIRGPRPKEAPGVALEEAAIRNYKNNRDPSAGDGIDEIVVDLAPTPRRPKGQSYMFDDEGEKVEEKAHDIAMKEEEEERRRRKLITERLFNAGSSSFEDEIKKPTAQDGLKTIPTVGTAESYGDEPVQESAERAANKELIQKIDDSGIKAGRGRRRLNMSFLKAGKRK
mmetsp:Transcript_18552/g.45968  ORF Transcript_18552/g.45968 Transcript_18552/m.45968 type:complete len:1107 (+) Transcript_18552:149-3469(+)